MSLLASDYGRLIPYLFGLFLIAVLLPIGLGWVLSRHARRTNSPALAILGTVSILLPVVLLSVQPVMPHLTWSEILPMLKLPLFLPITIPSAFFILRTLINATSTSRRPKPLEGSDSHSETVDLR